VPTLTPGGQMIIAAKHNREITVSEVLFVQQCTILTHLNVIININVLFIFIYIEKVFR
jgi:hypothetical protein